MSTVLLPMKCFEEELPPEVVPRLGLALALMLAPADAVGEADPVEDPAKFAAPDWELAVGAAAPFPAWDDPPQPATTASIAADTALANAKRHRRRGCGAGMSVLSFNHVTRPDNLQWSGGPERLLVHILKISASMCGRIAGWRATTGGDSQVRQGRGPEAW